MFLFPLIGVILLLRWLISDGGARSAISAKFHATSSYNARVGIQSILHYMTGDSSGSGRTNGIDF
jgi:hypothetical protein